MWTANVLFVLHCVQVSSSYPEWRALRKSLNIGTSITRITFGFEPPALSQRVSRSIKLAIYCILYIYKCLYEARSKSLLARLLKQQPTSDGCSTSGSSARTVGTGHVIAYKRPVSSVGWCWSNSTPCSTNRSIDRGNVPYECQVSSQHRKSNIN